MPDRYITPKRATYIVIALALVTAGLAYWVIDLSGRVGNQEEIARAEARGAAARAAQGCALVRAIVDVSIDLPLKNLKDILEGELTPEERVARTTAQTRYRTARDPFEPVLKICGSAAPGKK